mgnify:CR=1 FL=1
MTAHLPIASAQLDLGFARRGGRTVLERRLFSWPFVITRTFHLDSVPAEMLTVILQTSSGAIHGDDHLQQAVTLAPHTAVHLTTQGATAVHRAHPGKVTRDQVRLAIGAGAFLEYLPEPRVLFPGAAINQSIDVDCAPDATAIIGDGFGVHDPHGAGAGFRSLQNRLTLRFGGGEPVLIDRSAISRLPRGCRAVGSLLLVCRQDPQLLAPLAASITDKLAPLAGLYGAASLLPGHAGIGVRLAGDTVQNLRQGLELAWIAFRHHHCAVAPVSRRK